MLLTNELSRVARVRQNHGMGHTLKLLACIDVDAAAANRYSTEALVAAKHDFELQQDNCVHVHLDHRHMGVGGDDSWTPSVHEVSHVLHDLVEVVAQHGTSSTSRAFKQYNAAALDWSGNCPPYTWCRSTQFRPASTSSAWRCSWWNHRWGLISTAAPLLVSGTMPMAELDLVAE